MATVQKWWTKFEANPDLSVRDKARLGREKKKTAENIDEVRKFLEENAQRAGRAIAS